MNYIIYVLLIGAGALIGYGQGKWWQSTALIPGFIGYWLLLRKES